MTDSSISILNRTISSLEYDDSVFEKFTFQSVITKLEKPIGKGCPVHIINKITGQVVYKTETDETSSIYIPNLRKYNKYIVIAVDLTDVYNSTVFDLNWDFNSDKGYNYSLAYYDMADLDNIQSIFDFIYPTKVSDPNLVASISTPFAADGSEVSWFSTGAVRRDNIGTIPSYYFNGSSNIYLNRNVFARSLPFTFEAYFSTVSLNGSLNQCIFNQHNTALNKYVALYLDPSLNVVFERQEVIAGIPAIKLTSSVSVELDKNYHVAICYDGLTFYFFLNGVLQTTLDDSVGFPYYDYSFYIGQQFIGNVGGIGITESCKYTNNFDVLFQPISYNKLIYSDPSDTFAQYVNLLIKNNKLTVQPVIDDIAKNIRFQNNLSEANKNFFVIQNTFSPTVAGYSNVPFGTQDFCIEMCFKLLSKITYPTIVSNQSTATEWTSNNWAFTASHTSQLNKYSFWVNNSTTYNLLYPSIYKEQIDIAIVRQGTSLRFYVNGFLDTTITIAANLSIDSKTASYLAIGRDINFNLYDLRITTGHCRYTADYIPKQIDITNKDILEIQYQYLNLPFKKNLSDGTSPLITSYKDFTLSSDYSINGTKSAIFNGTSTSYLLDSWYTSKEKFCAEMFVRPSETGSTTQTLFSLYDATSEKFKVGIVNGKLSFNNGTSWTDTSYTMDYNKFNHIVIKREGTVLKVLANGSLVYTATVATALGNPLKVSIGSSKYTTEYFKGYINNLYIYKNYIKYTDTYTVPVEDIIVDPNIEPVVIVDQNTTSALDFENGLIDKITSTTWNSTGTAQIQNTNKIFGSNSFETKAIGDSLSTSSTLLTGGSSPYTIEFYALLKGVNTATASLYDPLFDNSFGSNGQGFYRHRNTGSIVYYRSIPNTVDSSSNGRIKLRFNEINKITITYDSSAIRVFVNDELDQIVGVLTGLTPQTIYSFFKSQKTSNQDTVYGLLDNVNIFNGVAKKVRNSTIYDEYLSVDLAFDGEQGSTRIIDNGKDGLTWTVSSNAILSTNRFLTGCSSLYSTTGRIQSNNMIPLGLSDFTIELELYNTGSSDIWCRYFMIGNNTTDGSLYIANNSNTESIIVDLYGNNGYLRVFTTAAGTVPFNKWNRIVLLRENGIFYLYINSVLIGSNSTYLTNNIVGDIIRLMSNNLNTERVNGNINSCRVYKDIAIRPDSIRDRIQLDFENNIVDNYGNSSWTVNSVTYDNVNSYRGSCAYFNSSTSYAESTSSSLNYTTNPFKISFDVNETDKAISREILSNNIASGSAGSIWIPTSATTVGFDYYSKPTNSLNLGHFSLTNTYYEHEVIRKPGNIYKKMNGCLIGVHNLPVSQSFNFVNGGTCRIGKPTATFNSGVNGFVGYLDNFKSTPNYVGEDSFDRPAIYIPMETSSIDIGYAASNPSVTGSPIYTSLDNKKCVRFGTGKFYSLSSSYNNLFNFGTDSDFYIEFEYNLNSRLAENNYPYLLNDGSTTTNYTRISLNSEMKVVLNGDTSLVVDYVTQFNTWYKVVLKRTGTALTLALYDLNKTLLGSAQSVTSSIVNFTRSNVQIGGGNQFNNIAFDGYMANFKMFAGVGELPSNFHPKKVLDLDFSPTGKSYLFKDKNNKCVIHPSGITSRNYLNGKYCCSFNGTTQSILLGNNEALNFGNDDFIIEFVFKCVNTTNWNILLANFDTTSGSSQYCYLGVSPSNSATNPNCVYATINSTAMQIINTATIDPNAINTVLFYKTGMVYTLVVNGSAASFTTPSAVNCNFNANSNTVIGRTNHNNGSNNHWFTGEMYSVKILRNTDDLSALD